MSLLKKLMYFAYLVYAKSSEVNGDIMPTLRPVGGERDDNNCLTGAGYSWCETSQSCIRRWETPCQDNFDDCNDCLKRQTKGENIACPLNCDTTTVNCKNDEDCGNSYFCRPTTMNDGRPTTINDDGPKECVKYSKEEDSCGGYTLPIYQSRCHPSLECVHSKSGMRPNIPMIADAPGKCMKQCDSNSVRNEYGNCEELVQDPVTISDPIVTEVGTTLRDNLPHCDIDCPSLTPCPSPGPDCEYTPPELNECGCIIGCNNINCHNEPTRLPPHICSDVTCMMYCENGYQIDENGCNVCSCNTINLNINTEELCPIPYEECDKEFVCPKITEITRCSEGGVKGTTTYQLSLIIINGDVRNVYAIFGDTIHHDDQMIIPSAYQVKNAFRSNIAGVPYDVLSLSPNSRYDSWLTIGITDGDPDNQLGTIGINFDLWDLNGPLIVDNGAVFTMNPDYNMNGLTEVIIGQLTIPSTVSTQAIVTVQGKLKYSENTWKQSSVLFSINPPIKNREYIPEGCTLWYDGCNNCAVNHGSIGACTKLTCFRQDTPRCIMYDGAGNGH